jgi:hypothetical protein
MKQFLLFIIFSILFFSCDSGPTEPGTPVTFNTVFNEEYDPVMEKGDYVPVRVAIEGYLYTKGMFTLSSDTFGLELYEKPGRKGKSITVYFNVGNSPNQAEELPDNYTDTDIKVHTHDDEIISGGELVRISGGRYGTQSENTCYIDADFVEKVQ